MGTLLRTVFWPIIALDEAAEWFVFEVLFHRRRGLVAFPLFAAAVGAAYVYRDAWIPQVKDYAVQGRDRAYQALYSAPAAQSTSAPSASPVAQVTPQPPTAVTARPRPTPTPEATPAATPKSTAAPAPVLKSTPSLAPTAVPIPTVAAAPSPTPVVATPTPAAGTLDPLLVVVREAWEERVGLTADLALGGALGLPATARAELSATLDDAARRGVAPWAGLARAVLAAGGLTPPGDALPEAAVAACLEPAHRKALLEAALGSRVEELELRALSLMPEEPADPDALLLPTLGGLARSPHRAVRERAAALLGAMERREALPFLKVLLQDPDGLVRVEAIAALARLGDPSGGALLEPLFEDASPEVRARAVRAASGFAGRLTAEKLNALREATSPEVRVAVALTQLAFGDEAGVLVLREELEATEERPRAVALEGVWRLRPSASAKVLLELLKAELPLEVKVQLCRVAGRGTGDRAVELGKTLLGKKRVEVRRALLERPSAELVRGLCAPLAQASADDRDEGVRALAVRALGSLGAQAPRAALERALADQAPAVRCEALLALARADPAGCAAPLRGVAHDPLAEPSCRLAAAAALLCVAPGAPPAARAWLARRGR